MRLIGVSLAIASWVLLGTALADDTPGKQKRADELFEQGRKLLAEAGTDKEKVAEACTKFDEAIKLDPEAPGTMLNLGLCNEKLEKYKTALYWFRRAQARASETKLPDYEAAAKEHTVDLAGKVATIKITFPTPPPAETKVKIDGMEISPADYLHAEVDPGPHTLVAGAPGKRIYTQEFTVEGRGGQTLEITFVEGDNTVVIDRGATRRKIAIFAAIGGGVLMLSAGGVALYAKSKYDLCTTKGKLDDPLTPDCPETDPVAATAYGNKYVKMSRRVGTSLFAAGGVAIAVAAVLYFTAPAKERIDRTVFVPTVSPDQVGFALSRSF
jgi:hypothetical protein